MMRVGWVSTSGSGAAAPTSVTGYATWQSAVVCCSSWLAALVLLRGAR